MDTAIILAAIDQEIGTLQRVRALLAGNHSVSSVASLAIDRPRRKRVLSAEARARIAAAQKRRWAKQKAAQKKAA